MKHGVRRVVDGRSEQFRFDGSSGIASSSAQLSEDLCADGVVSGLMPQHNGAAKGPASGCRVHVPTFNQPGRTRFFTLMPVIAAKSVIVIGSWRTSSSVARLRRPSIVPRSTLQLFSHHQSSQWRTKHSSFLMQCNYISEIAYR
jgi:hypothetical protein